MLDLILPRNASISDLRLLAASTHMTEISYSISDIQTRIFELQELRHRAQPTTEEAADSHTSVVDKALMSLDERLEQVSQAMTAVGETVSAFKGEMNASQMDEESAQIVRKHAALLTEWEAVQDESEVLREELKEDKWLTVFRTVSEQADGMMSSLEKAVNKCHVSERTSLSHLQSLIFYRRISFGKSNEEVQKLIPIPSPIFHSPRIHLLP